MKSIVLALALVSSCSAYANGAEEWELFGVSKSGKQVMLSYGGYELELANSRMATYRDPGRPEYGYCVPSASAKEREFFLRCSSALGSEPTLTFVREPDQERRPDYKVAKAMYKKHFKRPSHARSFGGYYRCVEGCNPGIAPLLVEVNYGD